MRRVGRYELGEELGRGASGTVYEAVLVGPGGLRRPVALKLLAPGRGSLLREARLGGLLRHRHLVDVYEVGREDGRWFCALELCDGSLAEHLPLSPAAVVEVGLQVCEALAYAHDELGLVHLDLKPANLLVSGGTVKVADLGIAHATELDGDSGVQVRGTPLYMAPEQRRGGAVDGRTDLYALGITLVELATGEVPVPSETLDMNRLLLGELPPPPETPSWLAPAVDRCLCPEPDDRWPSMVALAEALRALSVDGPSLAEVVGFSPPVAPDHAVVRGRLPEPTDALVGRDDEIAQVVRQVERHGVVSVKGPAGIGKTSVARAAAHAWQQGTGANVWFCDGSGCRHARDLVAELARTLGAPRDPRLPLGGVGHALAAQGESLVVLDNLEQIEAAAGVVEALRGVAPDTGLLLTSRAVTGVPGEHVIELGPLSAEAGADLVIRHARTRGVEVEREDPALRTLVERLDGLPLALELAAGRLGVLSVDEVVERLGPSLLRAGTVGRHATLQAALKWSWDLLSATEQVALAQLSVFAGSFRVEHAEAVLELQEPVLDVLGALDRRSMLTSGDGRQRLLAPVRAFAAARLDDPSAEVRHGVAYARLARAWDRGWNDLSLAAGLRVEAVVELPNMRAACRRAVARGDVEVALDTCGGAWRGWEALAPGSEAVDLIRSVLELDGVPDARRSIAFLRLGDALARCGRTEEARDALERSVSLARASGDPGVETQAQRALGTFLHDIGSLEPARRVLERAVELARVAGSPTKELQALGILVMVLYRTGRVEEAIEVGEGALVMAEAAGSESVIALVAGALGRVDAMQGRLEKARSALERALQAWRRLGNERGEAAALSNLAEVCRRSGDAEGACTLLQQGVALARQVGNPRSEGINRGNLGLALADLGRTDEALAAYERAIELLERVRAWPNLAVVLANSAHLLLQGDRVEEAAPRLERAVRIQREAGHTKLEGTYLAVLATTHRLRGDPEGARRDATTGLALCRQVAYPSGVVMALLELTHLEQPERALELCDQALEACREDPILGRECLLRRAELWVERGDLEAARADLRRMSVLPTRRPSAERRLSELRARLGER